MRLSRPAAPTTSPWYSYEPSSVNAVQNAVFTLFYTDFGNDWAAKCDPLDSAPVLFACRAEGVVVRAGERSNHDRIDGNRQVRRPAIAWSYGYRGARRSPCADYHR